MRPTGQGIRAKTVAIALLALSLVAVAFAAPLWATTTQVMAKDDDGAIEEDDNRGNGNDEDREDDDNPGMAKDKKEDDENAFVTPVPTSTPAGAGQVEPTVQPTQVVLTPVASPTVTATPPATTGTLVIHLRSCPDGTDPAIGTDALRDECLVGQPDADFALAARSGLFNGWRRDVTTDDAGDARVARLAEGTYSLTLAELDWCAAEASAVSDGLIVIEPGGTTEVTAYLCGDTDPGTPTGS